MTVGRTPLVLTLATALASVGLAHGVLAGGGGGKPEISKVKVGISPIDVAVGDFDRDGRKDLAITNFQKPEGATSAPFIVSILRGRKGGEFAKARKIKLGPADQVHGIEVARLGKGKDQDLVVGTFSDDVLLLKGRRGARFGAPVRLAIGEQPRRVATCDFNQDGLTDIAAARQAGDDIAVMLGQGGLGFGAPSLYSVGSGGGQLVAANLDPGGDPDLLVIDHDIDGIAVFRGGVGASFALTDSLVPPTEPFSFAVVDLNRDGRKDVVAGLVGDRPRLAVFRGEAGGSFAPPETLAVGPRPMVVQDIAVTKLNRDRDRDLVIVGTQAEGVRAARGLNGGGPGPTSRVLFLEGRAGIGLERVREVDQGGSFDAVATGRFDKRGSTDTAVTRDRPEKRGFAVTILNP